MANKQKSPKADEVGVMFRTPQEVRGAVRAISAWAEMSNFRINGKIPIEKDIWAWMAALLYDSGESKWPELLNDASAAFKKVAKPKVKPVDLN